jgi:uncharacterized protein (DUF2249 family)
MTSIVSILDVRNEQRGHRHQLVFDTFDALSDGQSFVLVNDHDPKPLRRQFEAKYSNAFEWNYLEAGPEIWRVRVGKAAT